MPVLDISVPAPSFDIVTSAPPVVAKKPSDYLRDEAWVSAFKSTVKGINPVELDGGKIANADDLHSNLRQERWTRASRIMDSSLCSRQPRHKVAGMCLAGHVLPDVKDCNLLERLIQLPIDAGFEKIFERGAYSEELDRLLREPISTTKRPSTNGPTRESRRAMEPLLIFGAATIRT